MNNITQDFKIRLAFNNSDKQNYKVAHRISNTVGN